jgi:hypothetical protein
MSIMLGAVIPSVNFYCYAECHYTEVHYAECYHAEFHYAVSLCCVILLCHYVASLSCVIMLCHYAV